MTAKDLLKTLDDLSEEEFKRFKWCLKQPDFLETYQTIKASNLGTADRLDTVDLMVNTYELHGALMVTKKVLEDIPRKDLVQSLPETCSGPEEKEDLDVFDLKKCFPSVEALLKPLPEVKASNTALVEPAGVRWLRPGLRKYSCELTIDTNTVNRKIKLSDNNRKAICVAEDQSYPDHPDRFDWWRQLLCRDGLTGRCYWEVKWRGGVYISVSYRGIRRRGNSYRCRFGKNNQSWSLRCSDVDGYSVWHNNREIPISSSSSSSSSSSGRVAVYVDCPAGSLSFYRVSSDTLIHLHTFNTTFTEPLYPGFAVWFRSGNGFFVSSPVSSVSLCSV
ncbi:neoverrucotoxin subunit alpha-like [Micropterus dolomieu]|uniref:neoverrucotoxin subunit alpha-like n=1 Tax=Micropterus dolomieu TaxID=147949 RepID=UPI001E8EC549|nr:neoverrucotoxin subunit alpha-like [Micropterus dolomieu]